MKKLLLLVGLVVLVGCASEDQKVNELAQPLNAKDYNINIYENHSTVTSKINKTTFGPYNKKYNNKVLNFDDCDETTKNSKNCTLLSFSLGNHYDNERELMNFLNGYAKDICNKPIVKINKFKRAHKRPLGFNSAIYLTIECPEIILERQKKLEEEKRLAREKDKEFQKKLQKEKEEELLASINLKKSLCAKIGFEDNSESMANCVFQLMMDENEKKLLDEKNTKIAEANKKKEEELKKQTMIIEQEIIRQKKAAQGAAIDQFLIDLINIFGGTQPQTTRTIPSGTICNLATWKVVSNAKICSYYCPSGNYAMQLRNYEVCPQQVRR